MIVRVPSCNEFVLTKESYVNLNYKKLEKSYENFTSPTAKEKMAMDMLSLNWENNELRKTIDKLVEKKKVEHNKVKFVSILFAIYFVSSIIAGLTA